MPSLILVLGDQLSLSMSSLKDANPESDIVLMAEVMEEATYVGHHKKKLAFVFSAMRHFAQIAGCWSLPAAAKKAARSEGWIFGVGSG